MGQRVLVIPIEEVRRHFQANVRQAVKIVVTEIWTEKLFQRYLAKGECSESEEPLQNIYWNHTPEGAPNLVCEAGDFVHAALPHDPHGPFCLAFANQDTVQDEHYHTHHIELYYSEAPISARYRLLERQGEEAPIDLPEGGVIVFGPDVVHMVKLGGMTVVAEFPAMKSDKIRQKI